MLKMGVIAIVLGLIALIAFKLIGSSIDANGVLHEPFGLLPIGFALLVAGAVAVLLGWVRRKTR